MPKKKKGAFDQAMDNFFDVANVMRKNLHSAGAAYGKAHQSAVNSIARPVSSAVKSAQQASKDTRVRPFAAHSAPCPLIVCRDHVAICYFYNVPSQNTSPKPGGSLPLGLGGRDGEGHSHAGQACRT